jgi:hypothetical protein
VTAERGYPRAPCRVSPSSQSPEWFRFEFCRDIEHALRTDTVTACHLLCRREPFTAIRRKLVKELSDLVALEVPQGMVQEFASHYFYSLMTIGNEKRMVLSQEAPGLYIRGPEHILVCRNATRSGESQLAKNVFDRTKVHRELRFLGTRAPFLRAFDKPIAMACLRLLTLRLPRPLLALPRL